MGGADVRTRILDAAMGLLAEGGMPLLTQPRISRAANVRQSHLTYYFPTVDLLLQALATHIVGTIVAELGAPGPQPRPGAVVATAAAASADKRRVRVMLGLVTAADRDPALKPRLREFIAELRVGLARLLQGAGIEATPDEVAFVHAVIVGCAVLQLARDNAGARREARATLARAFDCLGQRGRPTKGERR